MILSLNLMDVLILLVKVNFFTRILFLIVNIKKLREQQI